MAFLLNGISFSGKRSDSFFLLGSRLLFPLPALSCSLLLSPTLSHSFPLTIY
jgi:hypothetical protein